MQGLLIYLLLFMYVRHTLTEQLKLVDRIRSGPREVGSGPSQVQNTLLSYEASVQKYLGTALPF